MGRFRAAHFFGLAVCIGVVLLSGCSLSRSPLWATLGSFVPIHKDVSDDAKKISYASIDLSLGRRGGLLILAEQKDGLTFWQTGRDEVVVLNHGYLQATSGLTPRLEMSQAFDAQGRPVSMKSVAGQAEFVVRRSWVDDKGVRRAGQAQARWSCQSQTQSVKLPLTTRDLYKCVETLDWEHKGDTRSVYWRDTDGHVWKADVAAWPGGPEVRWQVARPWWPLS
ncbi:YjbF family lipoprotein [Salinisphaera sp. SPP-AMP-43]|uniref:YjbF family lipoprotein n=1 Tax=Salinisphaera sp. SPP-AMP-43 TaxID=3121288 RepID=UPI003C6DE3BF